MKNQLLIIIWAMICMNNVWAADYDSLIEEGNRYWVAKNHVAAQAAYEKAIQLNPKAAAGHARLAALLLMNNENKKAINAYQNAISADPSNPALFVAIGIAYLHEGSYSMAQAMVEQALKIDPNHINGKKLQEYVNKKMEVVAQASKHSGSMAPKDNLHKSVNQE